MCKKALCILLALLAVLCLTSFTAMAEETVLEEKLVIPEGGRAVKRASGGWEDEPVITSTTFTDTNGSFSKAELVTAGTMWNGYACKGLDTYDYFHFTITYPQKFILIGYGRYSLTGLYDSIRFRLYDSNKELVKSAVRQGLDSDGDDLYSIETSLKPGKYYIRVAATEEPTTSGNTKTYYRDQYAFVYAFKPMLDTPSISTSIDADSGKPVIKWGRVSNAGTYRVGRSTSKDGTYSTVGTVTGTSFRDKTAKPGTKYFYKVRAIPTDANTYAESFLSAAYTATCDCPRPTISATNKISTGKNIIKWNAVEGASKYELYYSTSKSGTYNLLTRTTATSVTHTKAVAGKTYYYKVRAYNSKTTNSRSAFSSVVARSCDLAQPVITVSNDAATGKVKISWKAVTNAKNYRLYYSDDGDEWNLAFTTTSTSAKDPETIPGETRYYKVRAMSTNSGAHSAYSAAKKRMCDLPRPTLSVKLNSAGKPRLSWSEVDGAVEYQVYRSKNGTDWSLLKTTSGTSLTNTSVASGRKYYYKVKAIADDSSANSAFSTVKSITAK